MIKLFLLLFSLSLFARENPFFPINSNLDVPLTSSQQKRVPPLQRATLSLPSTAREIVGFTVKYKNLDGSIATKSIELQNRVDWHLPIFISQNIELTNDMKIAPVKKHTKMSKLASLKFISIYAGDKAIKIATKDKLLRSFLLVKPQRIVCDFKRETDFGSYVKKSGIKSVVKQINIGTHNGYYRVVITLDGYYKYKVKKNSKGYFVYLM